MRYRRTRFASGEINKEERTVTLSFSSEEPYERSFGFEVLSHKPGAMVDERFRRGAVPFLLNHDKDRQIGTVLSHVIAGTKGYATVKLSGSQEGRDLLNDIEDGVRSNISVGYIVHEMKMLDDGTTDTENATATYLVTRWEPMEISLVSQPIQLRALGALLMKKLWNVAGIGNVSQPMPRQRGLKSRQKYG
jgi:phage head maturation protease